MKGIFTSWKLKILFLFLAILPSFTTYFINHFDISLFDTADISVWYVIYIILSFFIVFLISGSKVLTVGVVTAVTISISVVFMGGIVSYISSGFSTDDILIYSPHYLIVLLNTLAILPISIAFVSAIPIREFETNLLHECKGVSGFEKKMLISSRIFNHIIYVVIPKLLQIKKEENNVNEITFEDFIEDSFISKLSNISLLIKKKIQEYINLLLTLVVESLEFIPLWAIEINELPTNKFLNNERRKKENK